MKQFLAVVLMWLCAYVVFTTIGFGVGSVAAEQGVSVKQEIVQFPTSAGVPRIQYSLNLMNAPTGTTWGVQAIVCEPWPVTGGCIMYGAIPYTLPDGTPGEVAAEQGISIKQELIDVPNADGMPPLQASRTLMNAPTGTIWRTPQFTCQPTPITVGQRLVWAGWAASRTLPSPTHCPTAQRARST